MENFEINNDDDENYDLSTINKTLIDYDYKINEKFILIDINPIKEILRYNIINGLNSIFSLKIKDLDSNIYNINDLYKNNNNKLNELINKWCWHQYLNEKCLDVVIPYISDNSYEYKMIIYDFNYIFKTLDTENIITDNSLFIVELKKLISDYLFIEYHNFIENNENNNNFILKEIMDRKIKLICNYNNNTYKVLINIKVYNRLKRRLIINSLKYSLLLNNFDNIDSYLDNYLFCLLFRYSYLDSGNNQLAINSFIKNIFKESGVNFELFASSINSLSLHYCSLFYDIEKYFGSCGNFFNISLDKGVFWCNPPYDELILSKTADKLYDLLNSDKKLIFIITLPVWDSYTQNLLDTKSFDNIIRNNNDLDPNIFSDFYIYYKLKPFINDELLMPKQRMFYFNYKKYCYINAVNSYMLLVFNKNNNSINDVKPFHDNFNKIIELDSINYFSKF